MVARWQAEGAAETALKQAQANAERVLSAGRSKTWIKVKNPKAPAATRIIDGTF
jgi:hypothetical protein